MIQHWLQPPFSSPLSASAFRDHQCGARIRVVDPTAPNWTVGSIALIGWGDPAAYRAVCTALYTLSANFPKGTMVAVGLVRPDLLPLTELLEELIGKGVFPIVLARQDTAVEAQLRAQERRQEHLQLALVDAALPFSENDGSPGLLARLWARERLVGHTICLGSQAYLLEPTAVEALQARFGELHRLGALRRQLERVEPLVRQADVAAFSLNAIRAADAPAQAYRNPNGLAAEEACQILRYMGMSDTLSSLCIYGLNGAWEDGGQTANLVAQLVWFAVAGHQARLHELPLARKSLKAYVVDNKTLDTALTFYKSPKSDRWWFKIPLQLSTKGLLVACSYQDYQYACEGALPDRLLLAIQRLT